MNLLFAINEKFVPLFCSCVHSIVKNGGEEHYDAYILHSDLTEESKKAVCDGAGETVSCHFIDLNPEMFAGFPESKRYPKQIYYRLAAPLLLPENLDRILYLDVDLVVINPLAELYNMDFEDNYYIACTHVKKILTKINQKRLGTEKEVPYINTGVMLLNLPLLRENVKLNDIRQFAKEKMHSFLLPDQDILTALYGERVKLADTMRYNLSDRILSSRNANPLNPKRDLDWVRKNTVIVHYCGKNKPWNDYYIGTLGVFYKELNP